MAKDEYYQQIAQQNWILFWKFVQYSEYHSI